MRLSPQRAAALLACACLVSACGSTVQVQGNPAVTTPDGLAVVGGGDGLGAPVPVRAGVPAATAAAGTSAPGTVAPPAVARGGATAPTSGAPAAPVAAPVAAPSRAGAPAVTAGPRLTTPIEVGILDVGSSKSFSDSIGYTSPTTHSIQEIMRGLVTYYNGHGGIAGRQIKAVEYTAGPSDANYETDFSAACATFTQDHHVAVVLSQTAHQVSYNYESCLSRAGVVNLQGSLGGYDSAAFTQFPRLYSTSAVSVDRSLVAQLKGLTQSGFLTPKNTIGVLVEGCAWNTVAYDRTFAPLARQLGLNVLRRDFDCLTGFGNLAQAAGQVSAAVLPFASGKVDRVLFVSNYQGAAVGVFEKQASSQRYAPSYGVTSYATAGAYTSDVPAAARPRVQGVGWSTVADVTQPPAPAGADKRCRTMLAAVGITARGTADALSMAQECGQFFALEAALLASGGRSDAASLTAALDSLQGGSPIALGEALQFTPRRHDGPSQFAVFGYQAACTCFGYLTKPAPLA
jgi:hypothetical protein